MRYFPVFMDLQNQVVAVIGGGAVAERKIRLLLKAGARVRVVARELNEQVAAWQQAGQLDWSSAEYTGGQLDGARLVFAASDDAGLNRQVYADAESRHIPVNVVDDREHCRFITPAIVDRDPVTVAISSGGESPVLARRVRGWIERLLPTGLGAVASAAGRLRDAAAVLPLERRRQFWDRLLNRATIDELARKDDAAIDAALRGALNSELLADTAGTPAGRVILVGAGPGRADLLTIRAQQALGQADVILHDRLVPADILEVARRDAEFIDVGKRAGNHHETQAGIHELMVEHARRGRVVVRLKGGDPFVFGRGGEELEHLRAHDIDYEVVPGVTAATACAAFAGIPLTHREHSQALTLITGHTQPGGKDPAWAELAGEDRTLAIYMGVKQAATLRDKLLDAGLAPELPVALVTDGARDSQQVFHGSIRHLPALAARAPSGAPGLFIIGRVARLGEELAWFGQAAEAQRAA
ncbi:uroporphyrinogen-III C-methyltransferase [Marinihelvus fidelis]|uniref:Uroporphyrinogen-III C-methyltransferase n=1 Tax=Marinihelvus fidelis TaxID=2613842 RepID=A0A5N0TLL1_9GAMM|nr:siroheme synthase CysG [Marinihelvus fidelis]KAA9134219.1 uroporphyrinogen-III C-methyltransferase [Marinihelvus fidelis]